MFIKLDENKYITSYATKGSIVGGKYVLDSFLDSVDTERISAYRYEKGKAILDEERLAELIAQEEAQKATQEQAANAPSIKEEIATLTELVVDQAFQITLLELGGAW